MTSDLDIYRAAHLLIKRHGDDAAIEAAMRADELLAAVRELSDETPPGDGVAVH